MKKSLLISVVLVVLLACSMIPAMAKADRLEQIQEKGYIEFCTEPYWAPNEFIDPTKTGDEQYVGVDIEIAKAIAEKIGVDLKIDALDFSAVLVGTVDGKCDMAISAIAWNPTREMAMRLSDGYSFDEVGYGFLTREGEEGKYTSIEDLADAVVITQSGSIQEAIYNQYCNNAKQLKLVANMTDGYLAVAENKADVCITALESGALYVEANGGLALADFKFDNLDPKMSSMVVATPLDGTESFMEVINEVIADIVAEGKYTEWEEYYKEYAKSLGLN